VFEELRATKALDEPIGLSLGTEKRKEFERGLEILTFLAFGPLEFGLAHWLPAPLFRASPARSLVLSGLARHLPVDRA
jgi:hypothetical protein